MICLGVASERAIHWLAKSIEVNSQKYKAAIQKKRKGSIAALTKYLSDTVVSDIFDYDKHFAKELLEHLEGLATLYRKNRNEAGHPQAVEQTWLTSDQQILLLQFHRYITKIAEAVTKSGSNNVATTTN